MTSHTPGPWEARTFLIKGGDKMRDTICHVGTSTSLGPARSDESVANARLIAAAPDMLAALKQLSEADFSRLDDLARVTLANWQGFVRPIIAKAEGREG